MPVDDLESRFRAELLGLGARIGLMPVCAGIAPRRGTPSVDATITVIKETRWDRTYEMRLPALPGGPPHIGYAVATRTDTKDGPHVETRQIGRMLADHLDGMKRLDAIAASGGDVMHPPAWSIETQAATLDVMQALGGRPGDVRDFSPDLGGGLRAIVPGLSDLDAGVTLHDSIMEWQPSFQALRRWTYDASTREIRIKDRQLPDTALNAIRIEGVRVCDIVRDEHLDRVTTMVKNARNGEGCVFLALHARLVLLDVPPRAAKEWRAVP